MITNISAPTGYHLLRRIGSGATSDVFEVEKRAGADFKTKVALKLVHPDALEQPDFARRFTDEARLGGLLKHPHIIQVFDFGAHERGLYLAMELIDGLTLSQIVSRCRTGGSSIPLEITLKILLNVCEGLDYAHNATDGGKPLKMVHRDLKPANILVGWFGEVKIADFGVARAESNHLRTLIPGIGPGTPRYMSPEQARGCARLDHRSDLFSLGAILYEMLTLTPLYQGQLYDEVIKSAQDAEVQERLVLLEKRNLPSQLLSLLKKALARKVAKRFQSAAEMKAALGEVLTLCGGATTLPAFLASIQEDPDPAANVTEFLELSEVPELETTAIRRPCSQTGTEYAPTVLRRFSGSVPGIRGPGTESERSKVSSSLRGLCLGAALLVTLGAFYAAATAPGAASRGGGLLMPGLRPPRDVARVGGGSGSIVVSTSMIAPPAQTSIASPEALAHGSVSAAPRPQAVPLEAGRTSPESFAASRVNGQPPRLENARVARTGLMRSTHRPEREPRVALPQAIFAPPGPVLSATGSRTYGEIKVNRRSTAALLDGSPINGDEPISSLQGRHKLEFRDDSATLTCTIEVKPESPLTCYPDFPEKAIKCRYESGAKTSFRCAGNGR